MFNIIEKQLLKFEYSLTDSFFSLQSLNIFLILKLEDLIERNNNMREIFIEIKKFK